MKTKALVFSLATFAICSAAQAAPQLDCRAAEQNTVIEQLTLSADGKELVQVAPRARLFTKLVVQNVDVKNQSVTISGSVEPLENISCPGSCGIQTFELKTSSKNASPNAKYVVTTEGYDERTGTQKVSKRETKYDCTYSGFEAAPATVELKPGTFDVWPTKDLSDECNEGIKLTIDKGQVMGNIALLQNTMMGQCEKEIDYNPRYVKIDSVKKGSCGEIIMTGAVVEGSWYYTVEIVDSRSLTCRMMPEAQIVLKYKKSYGETKFYSYGQQQ